MASDFHTHFPQNSDRALVSAEHNCYPLTSLEYHPWHVPADFKSLPSQWCSEAPGCAALGETGLDKLRGPELAVQQAAFDAVLRIASEFHKPVVIHCVRAWEELFAAVRPYRLKLLIHGFRGSQELFEALMRRGFYVSFGIPGLKNMKFTPPPEALIGFETDDRPESIQEVLAVAAERFGTSCRELETRSDRVFDDFLGMTS